MSSTGSWAEYVLIGVCSKCGGESSVPMLVLLALLLGLEGTKVDHASVCRRRYPRRPVGAMCATAHVEQ